MQQVLANLLAALLGQAIGTFSGLAAIGSCRWPDGQQQLPRRCCGGLLGHFPGWFGRVDAYGRRRLAAPAPTWDTAIGTFSGW